jgi:23S rRNA (uracil1939-C5)-methyltransferase
LPAILNAGYRIERVEAVDMFPHTDHIETVVRLVRSGIRSSIR